MCIVWEGSASCWYSRIEMNATFDVGCRGEEGGSQLCKSSICIWSQHSLCKISSLALGVKALIIVIYEASDGAFFSHFTLSLGHDLQVQRTPGPFSGFSGYISASRVCRLSGFCRTFF